jgi:hypothetical protein
MGRVRQGLGESDVLPRLKDLTSIADEESRGMVGSAHPLPLFTAIILPSPRRSRPLDTHSPHAARLARRLGPSPMRTLCPPHPRPEHLALHGSRDQEGQV